MSGARRIDLGKPALLEFRGPDAVRFLNGQLTQDVRRVTGADVSLPSCVTDAKGRLQFRVRIAGTADGAIRVEGPGDSAESLAARLTRHLIADDVEVSDLTGKWSLAHFTGAVLDAPEGVLVANSARFGISGTDWWMPGNIVVRFPEDMPLLEEDALEAFRISQGIPTWGRELTEGLLPPEAGLDATDISYQKGCYVGQEVISRIKSAGKVNRLLARLSLPVDVPVEGGTLIDADGRPAGELTSVSPLVEDGLRRALAYVRRGVEELFVLTADASRHRVWRNP